MWEMISEGIGLLFVCSYVSMMDFFNFYTSSSGILVLYQTSNMFLTGCLRIVYPQFAMQHRESGEMSVDYLARQFTAVFDNAEI